MEKDHPNYYAWVVAYIDRAFLKIVDSQLSKNPEYQEVQAYIPTIRVLKKKFKGENHFDDIPLLFNYGFFKIPRKFAIHREFLDNMQKNIQCIYGWVKDPLKGDENDIAWAKPDEIARLIRDSVNLGAHSAEDLAMLKKGDIITLKNYPFDGMEAEFISMDEKRKKAWVNIFIFDHKKPMEVSFDNVFFSIYQHEGYDDTKLSQDSLDDMKDKNSLDKFTFKNNKP